MMHVLLVIFYLFDEIINKYLPVSSGSFFIVLLLFFMTRTTFSISKVKVCKTAIAGLLILVAGVIGGSISGSPTNWMFFVTTIIMLLLWLMGTSCAGRGLVINPSHALFGTLVSVFVLYASILLNIDVFSILTNESVNRSGGLFSEPSHLALYVMPLMMISWSRRSYRKFVVAAWLGLAYGAFSLTFALCTFVGVAMMGWHGRSLRNKPFRHLTFNIIKFLSVTVPIAGILLVLNRIEALSAFHYLSDRISGVFYGDSAKNLNLSALAYLQGVQIATQSFIKSYGLGVGLGNMGLSNSVLEGVSYREIIRSLASMDLNLRDGTFLLSKIVSELGVLSLFLLWVLVVAIWRLRYGFASYYSAFLGLAICLLFVRALPYFAAPTCLTLICISSVWNNLVNQRTRPPA
ncbi:hypothetical protein [Pandoraea sp.]|uniref:hypothetical protein n=1 Tax=Pandoraea sp. TaxID=1883445 RepID=UPI0035AEF49D